jgi:hypothetical protein
MLVQPKKKKKSAPQVAPRVTVASRACIACKQRKGKCCGNPCTYCVTKNIQCEFVDGKKRGPTARAELPTTISASPILIKNAELFRLRQQSDFLDFYFQLLGALIPMEFKAPLLSTVSYSKHPVRLQLCIVYAHVMSTFGEIKLAEQYSIEAHRIAPQLFNSATKETAVALLMMAQFLWGKDNRAWIYSTNAANIAKILPAQTPEVKKTALAAHILGVLSDPNTTGEKKASKALKALSHYPSVAPREIIINFIARIRINLGRLLKIRFGSPTLLFESFFVPAIIEQSAREELLRNIEQLEDFWKSRWHELEWWGGFLKFYTPFLRFELEWRCNNITEATSYALEACKLFMEDASTISIKEETVELLLLPYFLKDKVPAIALETFVKIKDMLAVRGKEAAFWDICSKINFSLITPTDKIEELETELFSFSPEQEAPTFEFVPNDESLQDLLDLPFEMQTFGPPPSLMDFV